MLTNKRVPRPCVQRELGPVEKTPENGVRHDPAKRRDERSQSTRADCEVEREIRADVGQ